MYVIPEHHLRDLPFSICVYCGSRSGDDEEYGLVAKDLGQAIARQGWRLVYGAGNAGLMGQVATSAQLAGGEVFGVIPTHMPEQLKPGLETTVFTCNMNERKNVLQVNSDAFVIMPGGFGTLDELFEVLTLKQLGQHDKPIHLLDVNGYWDELLLVFDKVVRCGFASERSRGHLNVNRTVPGLIGDLNKVKLAVGS